MGVDEDVDCELDVKGGGGGGAERKEEEGRSDCARREVDGGGGTGNVRVVDGERGSIDVCKMVLESKVVVGKVVTPTEPPLIPFVPADTGVWGTLPNPCTTDPEGKAETGVKNVPVEDECDMLLRRGRVMKAG